MAERSSHLLSVNLLFGDALGGKFSPPTDPLHREHTLGRLLEAGYEKGVLTDPTDEEKATLGRYRRLHAVRHQPSWAQGVESNTFIRSDERLPVMGFACGIILRAEVADASLAVIFDQRNGQLIVSGDSEPITLALGPEIDANQAHVAQTAQTFFDRVHGAQG